MGVLPGNEIADHKGDSVDLEVERGADGIDLLTGLALVADATALRQGLSSFPNFTIGSHKFLEDSLGIFDGLVDDEAFGDAIWVPEVIDAGVAGSAWCAGHAAQDVLHLLVEHCEVGSRKIFAGTRVFLALKDSFGLCAIRELDLEEEAWLFKLFHLWLEVPLDLIN